MKNFKALKEFSQKTYYAGLELFCTGLTTVLNKSLRQLIIYQGKDPDYVKPSIRQLIDEEFNKMPWGLPEGYLNGARIRKVPQFLNKKEIPANTKARLEPPLAPTIEEPVTVEVVVPLETVVTPIPASDIDTTKVTKPRKRSAKKRTAP